MNKRTHGSADVLIHSFSGISKSSLSVQFITDILCIKMLMCPINVVLSLRCIFSEFFNAVMAFVLRCILCGSFTFEVFVTLFVDCKMIWLEWKVLIEVVGAVVVMVLMLTMVVVVVVVAAALAIVFAVIGDGKMEDANRLF